MARLARPGDGVEAPNAFSGFRVIGVDKSPDAVFAARRTDDDLVLDRQRSHGQRVPFGVIHQLAIKQHGSGLAVQSQEASVERPLVEAITRHGQAAIQLSAAEVDSLRQPVLIPPEHAARPGVERGNIVVRLGQVHDAVDDQRRGLELVGRAGLKNPFQFKAHVLTG